MTDSKKRIPSLNLSAIHEANYVNGPGRRFVVWVQGCHLGCPSCWNKHTWSFAPNWRISADEVFLRIVAAGDLDGVTFTGGEPFLQPRALAHLARRVKNELNLSLQIFTGFELSELKGQAQHELLSLADVVVAGRYDPAMSNNNQKVHELSDVRWDFNNSDVEIEIAVDGGLLLTGYPTDELISDLQENIK